MSEIVKEIDIAKVYFEELCHLPAAKLLDGLE
ncbi:hypothetical protein SAMN04488122_4556 [Chitinophaga arvensicola]|uniref:Uncharacterized protein n=1 Tax=Chitinophaga arvensicola TaxID=29529 RepID=A0A1I0S7S4_9BACT|nr:hypothetical protein SAMN04488122_4556 [Chitinophaga arvensicola]